MRDGIRAAINAHWLILSEGSVDPNCEYDQARQLLVSVRTDPPPAPPPPSAAAKLDVAQLQELADRAPTLLAAAGSAELDFEVSVTLTGDVTDEERTL